MILIYFLINFILKTEKVEKAIVKIIVENEINEKLEKVKIIYFKGKEEEAIFTNEKGTCQIEINKGVNLLKFYKLGYENKGYVGDFKDEINNLLLNLKPKTAQLKGIISNNTTLKNVSINLIDEKGKTITTTKSNKKGLFTFFDIPLFRKHYLKVLNEGSLPYKSDEIILKEKRAHTRNIHLKNLEINLVIEIVDKKNNPIAKLFVEAEGIENEEKETDINGLTFFKLNKLPFNNQIKIKIKEYNFEKVIKIEKGKSYLNEKIIIN